MATTDLGTLTDAIPLLDDNGSGVYIKGRNDISDFRRQFMGAIFAASATGPFAPRAGVIPTSYNTITKVWNDKRVSAQAVPNQQITLGAGRSVCNRTNQGSYLVSQETDLTVSLPAADATNARIDVIYEMPFDKGVGALGDTLHGPHLICETGTPAGSPVAPSVPANALVLAQVFRRTTGATPSGNVIQSTDITDKRRGVSVMGGPRLMLPGDLLADAGLFHGEIRVRTEQAGVALIDSVYLGLGHRVLQDVWDAVGAVWRGVAPANMTIRGNLAGFAGVTQGQLKTLCTLTVPDPGYPYRVRFDMLGATILNAQTGFDFQIKTGGTGGANQFYNNGAAWSVTRNGDTNTGTASGGRGAAFSDVTDSIYTGQTVFTATAQGLYQNGAATADLSAITNGIVATIIPV